MAILGRQKEPYMRLGQILKDYMWIHHLGSRQLANELGMSHTTITRFLNGRTISSDHFLKIWNWLTEDVPNLSLNSDDEEGI